MRLSTLLEDAAVQLRPVDAWRISRWKEICRVLEAVSHFKMYLIQILLKNEWQLCRMLVFCHDPTSRFVYIMAKGVKTRQWILPEDLITMVQDVVDTHPGLAFLKEAAEFHSRYVHTVIARIFYTVNRSWSGRISLPELRRSNLLQVRSDLITF